MALVLPFTDPLPFSPPTPPPTSAGIGRTGVLITMETAMCLIERSQDVYPLDIVRSMRDQRAMMIQTAVSSEAGFFFPRSLCFSKLFREIQEAERSSQDQRTLRSKHFPSSQAHMT